MAVDPIYRPNAIPVAPELTDGRVLLRNWNYSDLACVEEAEVETPPFPSARLCLARSPTRRGSPSWRGSANGQLQARGSVLPSPRSDPTAAVGLVCLLHRQQLGVVGIGYWTVASRRRQGFASGGLDGRAIGRSACRKSSTVEALVEPSNEGSIRVLEGAGFRREGLLRGYLDLGTRRADALLYSLIRQDIERSTE